MLTCLGFKHSAEAMEQSIFVSIRSISNEAGQPYPRKGGRNPQKPPRRTGGYRREATCTVWWCESMAFPGEMSTLEDLFGNSRLIEIRPRHLGCGGMRCGHAMSVHLVNALALSSAVRREEATRSRQSAKSCSRAQNRGSHTVETR